jgi:hypothetical protein
VQNKTVFPHIAIQTSLRRKSCARLSTAHDAVICGTIPWAEATATSMTSLRNALVAFELEAARTE